MTGTIALADVERLFEMANSERPLIALPARRQIIEWARAPDAFETEVAFNRACELATGFSRTRRVAPEEPPIRNLSGRRFPAIAASASA